MADYPLPCTWEQVVDAVDHRNTAVMLENRNDPDLGNIIWSSLSGSQIYDLVRPRTEVGTIRQNVYAVDPSGRRCLLIGEPQTSTSTVVFAVIDGTTQYVYSIPNGGSLVNLTTIQFSADSGDNAKVNTIAVVKSGNVYSFYGADFDFSSLDEIMANATNGTQYRMAVINSQDVYPLSHMQGSQSTARLYFSGITWGTGMTSPLVEVFELDQILAVTKVSSVEVPSIPKPTAADNGKFLTVVNGAYTLTSVPAAESGVF